jgi:hypothetical protein
MSDLRAAETCGSAVGRPGLEGLDNTQLKLNGLWWVTRTPAKSTTLLETFFSISHFFNSVCLIRMLISGARLRDR